MKKPVFFFRFSRKKKPPTLLRVQKKNGKIIGLYCTVFVATHTIARKLKKILLCKNEILDVFDYAPCAKN